MSNDAKLPGPGAPTSHIIRVRVQQTEHNEQDEHSEQEQPYLRAEIHRALSLTNDIVVVPNNAKEQQHMDNRKNENNERDNVENSYLNDTAAHAPADVIVLGIDENSSAETLASVDSNSSTPMVGYSEISEAELLKSILARGLRGFVQRSESPDLLVQAIRAVAADEQYLSPETERILSQAYDPDRQKSESTLTKQRSAIRAIESLTPRELQVLQLITSGNSTSAAAESLGLSVKTIETHRKNIGDKIGTRNLASLTKMAILAGLISL